jgi:hypothetical protein
MTTPILIRATEAFLNVFRSFIGLGEIPKGSNAGQFVEWCQAAGQGKKGDAWCVDAITRAGLSALGPLWPLPRTGSAQELADWGKAKGIAIDHKCDPKLLEPGDILLVYFPSHGRIAHGCAVESVKANGQIFTIDGNTVEKAPPGSAASREGWATLRKDNRTLHPNDVVLRWEPLIK